MLLWKDGKPDHLSGAHYFGVDLISEDRKKCMLVSYGKKLVFSDVAMAVSFCDYFLPGTELILVTNHKEISKMVQELGKQVIVYE
jgi:hypothetical protein